jgi:glycerol-3-phosphate dehydrogenase
MMTRDFSKLSAKPFDLLVCGGGVYGAWTAYDAALRGLKTAIIDKGDWAGGTSSASSKLIHGGLRYLETFDFKLVKKSLSERQMLLHCAPHRVWPLRFGIPVTQNGRLNRLSLALGLSLYDGLAGQLAQNQHFHYHNKPDFIAKFSAINTAGLLAGFTYFDAQTDDARFVLEIIDGAGLAGAVCVNYCAVDSFVEENGRIKGVKVCDQITGEFAEIKAKQVVDTTGRWSVNLRKTSPDFRLSKGIHLLLPKIDHEDALLLTANSDGRVFFVIPWYGKTLVGTTDSNYQGDLDKLTVTEEEETYLLAEVNRALPSLAWTAAEVIGRYAGLRVLRQSNNDSPGSISRDWSLETAPNGLLSSIGGKFTSAREDAGLIVDAVCQNLTVDPPCQTFGKVFPWLVGIDFPKFLEKSLADAQKVGIAADCAIWLVRRYGKHCADVLALCQANPQLSQKIRPDLPFIVAELKYCAQYEMVITLEDLLRRRLPLLLLAKLSGKEIRFFAAIAAENLNWDREKIEREIQVI